MNRKEFHATVDRLAWTIGESAAAEIKLAADEYAARLVDECARLPQRRTIAAAVWRERALVADEIAASLEALADSAPATSPSERVRLAQALDDAQTARRIGRTRVAMERAS
jgi:hypothetical protein